VALNDIVRSGVALADKLTASLQSTVTIEAWIADDLTSPMPAPVFAEPIRHAAIVEQRAEAVRTVSGETVMTKAQVTFIHPITPNGAVGRIEPIDPRDRIILADGTTGAIVLNTGLVNPATGGPYLQQVSIA
jgi:hypothetical protein